MKTETKERQNWLLLPGGMSALLRMPYQEDKLPDGNYRKATHAEIIAANQGAPYPWGYMPENKFPTKMWQEKRIGYGGLIHDAWFILQNDERIGGAPNVPEVGPGAQRYYLLTSGGLDSNHQLNDNEGYALVMENLPKINDRVYRTIHAHVAKHVSADRGGVIISPIEKEGDTIYVGFVGRCMTCPNPERISIEALKHACPGLNIELHPSWLGWNC
jgi:Fe-S cluster biogenesis protein NfuA